MSSETVKMSAATKNILRQVKKMVPPMLEKFHKGTFSPHQYEYPLLHILQDNWDGWQ
jgi:hypothetical protein